MATPGASTKLDIGVRTVDLDRFLEAQQGRGPGTPFAQAMTEMKCGRKRSCWIWYVFPQFLDIGRASSRNNQKYQIFSKAEAMAYLQHEVLGPNYLQIAEAVAKAIEQSDARVAMGGVVDAKKLHQSVTVFHRAAKEADFTDAIEVLSNLLQLMFEKPYKAEQTLEDLDMVRMWEGLQA
eukprot:TRINITY_DN121192_c0_g1_i1.p1 TRINITY_DN121192_c0_g1~~TRINITY_DN121192_c0_g1_i1.p1  ORF type:complete len:179 (+),score=35.11 TRINITY_DN121192_c0_g1_i1:58-594(+)